MFGEIAPKMLGKYAYRTACQVYATGSQTIASYTATVIAYEVKNIDTGNFFNTTTSIYTPSIPGYYFITLQITFAPFATGTNSLVVGYIYKNSASIGETFQYTTGGLGEYIGLTLSKVVFCNGSTDYLNSACYQASGASQALTNPDGQIDNYMSIVLVGLA